MARRRKRGEKQVKRGILAPYTRKSKATSMLKRQEKKPEGKNKRPAGFQPLRSALKTKFPRRKKLGQKKKGKKESNNHRHQKRQGGHGSRATAAQRGGHVSSTLMKRRAQENELNRWAGKSNSIRRSCSQGILSKSPRRQTEHRGAPHVVNKKQKKDEDQSAPSAKGRDKAPAPGGEGKKS